MKIKFITLAIISLFFSKLVSAETAPGFGSWDDVLKAADGGQVNVYMWGGSDAINGFVVEKGAEIGLTAPANAALVEAVTKVETGKSKQSLDLVRSI